ncbi:SH3 domain protein, partial [Opisthorchis viverrini]
AIKAGSARQVAAQLKAKEEEELAKAIALSLKESGNKRPTDSGPSRTAQPSTATTTASSNLGKSNLYPEFAASTLPRAQAAPVKGRVRALYDFEAAEDNELTFKAGELIVLLDDSDENWWRGSNHRGEGLFPAQFVKCETEESPSSKKKDMNGPVTETPKLSKPVQLDAKKLDECLRLISMVDPTGEFRPDPPELPQLEAECNAMAPLVDPELEKVDKRVLMLSELNQRLLDAFQMYHDLMSEPPPLSAPYYGGGAIPAGATGYMPPMGAYGAPQPGAGGVPYGAGALHQPSTGVSYTAVPETMYPSHMTCTSQYPQATTQPLSSAQYPPPAYYSATQHPVDANPTSSRHQQQQQHYAVSDVFPAAYSSQYPAGHTDPAQPGLSSRYPGTAEAPPNPYYYGYGTTTVASIISDPFFDFRGRTYFRWKTKS